MADYHTQETAMHALDERGQLLQTQRLELGRAQVDQQAALVTAAQAADAAGLEMTDRETEALRDREAIVTHLQELESGYRQLLAQTDAELAAATSEEARNAILTRRLQLLTQLHAAEGQRRAEEAQTTAATRASSSQITAALGQVGTALLEQGAAAVLNGQLTAAGAKQAVHGALEGIAIKSVVKVAEETAEGLSALAGIYTAPLAAGHFAAAAEWAGVGVLTGLGAIATAGAAPSTGAGAASAATSAPATAGEPARAGGSGGPAMMVFNFGGPVIAGRSVSNAEIGMALIHDHLNAAIRERGATIAGR